MSLVRGRVAATLFAVAGLAAILANKFVLQPLFFRIDPVTLGFLAGTLTLVLALAGPVLGYLWLTRPLRRRPATFELSPDGPAFVVPEMPVFRGLMGILLMVNAGNLVPAERAPDTDRIRLTTISGFVPVLVPVAAVLVVFALVTLWLPSPSLMLTPAGITVRFALRGRGLSWNDLLPGGPPSVGGWAMPLLYRRPSGREKRFDIPVFYFNVDHVFLATVVRHYTERPEHRTAIGTQRERERLESSYAAWRSRPATVAQLA